MKMIVIDKVESTHFNVTITLSNGVTISVNPQISERIHVSMGGIENQPDHGGALLRLSPHIDYDKIPEMKVSNYFDIGYKSR